jgi:hypothetical protein
MQPSDLGNNALYFQQGLFLQQPPGSQLSRWLRHGVQAQQAPERFCCAFAEGGQVVATLGDREMDTGMLFKPRSAACNPCYAMTSQKCQPAAPGSLPQARTGSGRRTGQAPEPAPLG